MVSIAMKDSKCANINVGSHDISVLFPSTKHFLKLHSLNITAAIANDFYQYYIAYIYLRVQVRTHTYIQENVRKLV